MERVGYAAQEMASGTARDDDLAVASRTHAAAFETLYDRHRLAVYRYLRSRASNGDDAADLTALTFERAFVSIGGFYPGRSGVRAWLMGIARNAAIDHERHRRSEPPAQASSESDDGPESRFVANETASELRAWVALLPTEQREAISLRFAGGLTAKEIGAVLGKSEAASQKLVSRGPVSSRIAAFRRAAACTKSPCTRSVPVSSR